MLQRKKSWDESLPGDYHFPIRVKAAVAVVVDDLGWLGTEERSPGVLKVIGRVANLLDSRGVETC